MHEIVRCPKCGYPLPSPLNSAWFQKQSQPASPSHAEVLRVSDLTLDPASHDVFRAGTEIKLSRIEFRLLESLMKRSGRVVSRGTLIHLVWNSSRDVNDNLVDVTIYHLRKKVDLSNRAKLIRTVRGLGYAIRKSGTPAAID